MTNEAKLVTLPKEVAEAIESLLAKRINRFGIIIGMDAEEDNNHYPEFAVLNRYFNALDEGNERHGFMLMSALVNGYQVEKTPEEQVQVYYSEIQTKWEAAKTGWPLGYYEGSYDAIQTTLGILGIKIEGVNA